MNLFEWFKFYVLRVAPPDVPTSRAVYESHNFDHLNLCRDCGKTFGELFMRRIPACSTNQDKKGTDDA